MRLGHLPIPCGRLRRYRAVDSGRLRATRNDGARSVSGELPGLWLPGRPGPAGSSIDPRWTSGADPVPAVRLGVGVVQGCFDVEVGSAVRFGLQGLQDPL